MTEAQIIPIRSKTHRWGEPIRFQHKTERCCTRPGCPIVKVTRHENGIAWVEYWSGLDRIGLERPPCNGPMEGL
jgi:hypothetical protein